MLDNDAECTFLPGETELSRSVNDTLLVLYAYDSASTIRDLEAIIEHPGEALPILKKHSQEILEAERHAALFQSYGYEKKAAIEKVAEIRRTHMFFTQGLEAAIAYCAGAFSASERALHKQKAKNNTRKACDAQSEAYTALLQLTQDHEFAVPSRTEKKFRAYQEMRVQHAQLNQAIEDIDARFMGMPLDDAALHALRRELKTSGLFKGALAKQCLGSDYYEGLQRMHELESEVGDLADNINKNKKFFETLKSSIDAAQGDAAFLEQSFSYPYDAHALSRIHAMAQLSIPGEPTARYFRETYAVLSGLHARRMEVAHTLSRTIQEDLMQRAHAVDLETISAQNMDHVKLMMHEQETLAALYEALTGNESQEMKRIIAFIEPYTHAQEEAPREPELIIQQPEPPVADVPVYVRGPCSPALSLRLEIEDVAYRAHGYPVRELARTLLNGDGPSGWQRCFAAFNRQLEKIHEYDPRDQLMMERLAHGLEEAAAHPMPGFPVEEARTAYGSLSRLL